MKTKKFLALLLAAGMTLGLFSACGGSNSANTDTTETQQTTETAETEAADDADAAKNEHGENQLIAGRGELVHGHSTLFGKLCILYQYPGRSARKNCERRGKQRLDFNGEYC